MKKVLNRFNEYDKLKYKKDKISFVKNVLAEMNNDELYYNDSIIYNFLLTIIVNHHSYFEKK
ncbi:MAG: hypothetical protein ACOCV1_04610 [Bacillota bacterium]